MSDGTLAPRAAALLMVGAMGLYAANDALVKAGAPNLTPGQLLALRAAIGCLVFAAIMHGPYPGWQQWLHWKVVLRCSLELAATGSLLTLARIPLATAAAVMMIAPVLATLASFLMQWEPWRGGGVAAVFCGLCGTQLVLQPSAENAQALAGGTWALVCAVSLAIRDLLTRRLPSDLPSTGVAGMATAFVCVAGLSFGSAERWMAPAGPAIAFVESDIDAREPGAVASENVMHATHDPLLAASRFGWIASAYVECYFSRGLGAAGASKVILLRATAQLIGRATRCANADVSFYIAGDKCLILVSLMYLT